MHTYTLAYVMDAGMEKEFFKDIEVLLSTSYLYGGGHGYLSTHNSFLHPREIVVLDKFLGRNNSICILYSKIKHTWKLTSIVK